MGWFDRFKKKEKTFANNQEYFFDILGTDPIRIDLTRNYILDTYYSVPQIASIINYSSKVFSNNDLRYYNDKGEESDNEFLEVLRNPHPLYSQGEFWETFSKQFELFNIVLTYKVQGTIGNVSGLFILPFHLVNIIPKDNLKPTDIFLAQELEDIIDHYELTYNNLVYKIPVEDIWMVTGSSLKFDKDQYLIPDSIIDSLKYPIENVKANYQARFSLVENRGALGIWVNNATDDYGKPTPLEEPEKDEIYKTFRNRFGLTKNRQIVGLTDANIRWESSSIPLKDLELNQAISQDKITFCDAFSFPILLLNELEGSTYSNLDIADRNLYTKKTIPFWELVSKSITREFTKTGYFEFYTGNIEVLKKDDKVQAETNEINTRIISDLNEKVIQNIMTYDVAVNTLVLIANIPEDIAKEVISNIQANESVQD